jgi:YegS/Rv2252/BmrU family lipid kinase
VKSASVIINPISGAGADAHAADRRVAMAREAARAAALDVEIAISDRAGHPRELALAFRSAGTPLVIAWGGDGTVNEIASALAYSATALAIVPAGSGNGLATELGISRDPRVALKDAFTGADRRIDAGEVNGRLFVNLLGIGFDGHIARQFQQLAQGRRGALPYLTIGLRSVWRYRPSTYRLTIEGETIESRALLVAFANSCQYGNNAVIAPRAKVDDGKLEVVIVKWWPAPLNFLRLHHLFRRTADRAPGVISRAVRDAVVEADAPMEMHVDGEIVDPSRRATVRALPGALILRVPLSTSAGTARGTAR